MYLIRPSYEILEFFCSSELIEKAGRTCYKSECKGDPDAFVRMINSRNHASVLEHSFISVKFIVDRGVSHELVRHRLCSFSQESTRYCNYNKKGITYIIPPWFSHLNEGIYNLRYWYDAISFDNDKNEEYDIGYKSNEYHWLLSIGQCEEIYNILIKNGQQPQQARSVLPNSLKTEIVMSANAREWRHIFNLRCHKSAHPQMREIMIPLLKDFQQRSPALFDDIKVDNDN
jgi:thymidylate synthase (FAD)